jgi:hypothetical protein
MFEVEIAFTKLKKYTSTINEQVMAQIIHARGKIVYSEIHKLINSPQNECELPQRL